MIACSNQSEAGHSAMVEFLLAMQAEGAKLSQHKEIRNAEL